MSNLLQETLAILKDNNKSPEEVLWCSSEYSEYTGEVSENGTKWKESFDFHFPFSDFIELANFEYDSGFGWPVVSSKLKIVGDNWWLERGEYDGSEWWEFKTLPTKPDLERKPTTLKDK